MKKLLISAILLLSSVCSFSAPINIIVPTPPGGVMTDMGLALSASLTANGIENIVTYHPGAGGDIGLNEALKQKDNVIFTIARGFAVFTYLPEDKDNRYSKELTMVAPIVGFSMGFESGANNFKSLKEMIEYAKVKPLACGTAGAHGSFELLRINQMYGTKFEPITYKGSAQIRPDLVEGSMLKCAYDGVPSNVGMHEVGKLKILSTDRPVKGLDIPTISSVLPGYSYSNWLGFGLPKSSNLLKDEKVMNIIKQLNKSPELKNMISTPGFYPTDLDKNIDQTIDKEINTYRKFKL